MLGLIFLLRGVMHIAHHMSRKFSNVVIEYLGEIETEFKNTLACLSGAQMGSKHGKSGGRKSCDTLPLIKWYT